MHVRASSRVVASLFLAAAWTASCSSASSSPAPASAVDGGDGDAPSLTGAWAAGTCGACVTSACTGERQVCDAEPSCAAHARCADACRADPTGAADAACLAACPRGDNTVASRARSAYDTCLTGAKVQGCAACPVAPPPASLDGVLAQTCSTSTETNACFKCEDLSCCKTFDACVAEPECKQGLQPCLTACKGDLTCEGQCYDAHPKGVATWARRQTCMLVRCAPDCGTKPDACLECSRTTTCRDPFARCSADAGCFLVNECFKRACTNTPTDACIDTCKQAAPASAAPLFDAWVSCVTLSCSGLCT